MMMFIKIFIWTILTYYSECESIIGSSCNCKAHSYDFNVPEDARQRIDFRKYIH